MANLGAPCRWTDMAEAFMWADQRVSAMWRQGAAHTGKDEATSPTIDVVIVYAPDAGRAISRVPAPTYLLFGVMRALVFTWPQLERFLETCVEQCQHLSREHVQTHGGTGILVAAALPLAAIPDPAVRYQASAAVMHMLAEHVDETTFGHTQARFDGWLALLLEFVDLYAHELLEHKVTVHPCVDASSQGTPVTPTTSNSSSSSSSSSRDLQQHPLTCIQRLTDMRYQCSVAAGLYDGQRYLPPDWRQCGEMVVLKEQQGEDEEEEESIWSAHQLAALHAEWQQALRRYAM